MSGARVTIRLDDKAALAAIGRLRRVAFGIGSAGIVVPTR